MPFRCGWPMYDGSTCDQPAPMWFPVRVHLDPAGQPAGRVPAALYLCDTHNPERREG